MSEPAETVIPFPKPLPPELEYLVAGVQDEAQRNAILVAFYRTAQGDPESFPVAFATLCKALLGAQERLIKRTEKLVRLAESAEAIVTGAGDFAVGVEKVTGAVKQLMDLQAVLIVQAMAVAALLGALVTTLGLIWTGHLR
jgi:hypothetical protein